MDTATAVHEPNVGTHRLYSFLTTEPNDVVRPVHAKAIPVVLTTPEQCDEWMRAPASAIETIQSRPLPSDELVVLPDDEAALFVGATSSDRAQGCRNALIARR
jgi:putative SOS response-associated peptidase YedK